MAIDQTPSTSSPESKPTPVIDNEFPTYRAISSMAVFSVVLALASVFCFTSLWFLLVVAAAVLSGWLAIRKIRQYPEILTGASYARVGIGVSLLFGLAAVTHELTESFVIEMDARSFANLYIEVIKEKPIAVALWYQQNPEYRNSKTPEQALEELKKATNPMNPDPYKEKASGIEEMKARLKGEGETIHFSKVESKAIDGLTVYANALIEFDGPGTGKFPKEQFALLQLIKRPGAGRMDWVVNGIKFPYTPESAVATVEKPVDDGHGHAH